MDNKFKVITLGAIMCGSVLAFAGCTDISAQHKQVSVISATYDKNGIKVNEKVSTDKKTVYEGTATYSLNLDQNSFVAQGFIDGVRYYLVPITNINGKVQNIRVAYEKTQVEYSDTEKPKLEANYKYPEKLNTEDPTNGYSFKLTLYKGYTIKDYGVIKDKKQQEESELFYMPYIVGTSLSNDTVVNSSNTNKSNVSIDDDGEDESVSSSVNTNKSSLSSGSSSVTTNKSSINMNKSQSQVQEEEEENNNNSVQIEEEEETPSTATTSVEEDESSSSSSVSSMVEEDDSSSISSASISVDED